MTRRWRLDTDRRAGQRGQALVETALVLPIVVMLVMGLFDLGRGVYAMSAVSNAAREGARTAIVNQVDADVRGRAAAQATALGIDATLATTQANCPAPPHSLLMTPAGASGVCVQFLSHDLTAACAASASYGCIAVVTVKSTYVPLTPLLSQVVGSVPVISRAQQPVESVCTTGTCPVP